jgi:hypothetical protein
MFPGGSPAKCRFPQEKGAFKTMREATDTLVRLGPLPQLVRGIIVASAE